MIVSDPSTDKSAASFDVNIGSMVDPKDLPGLAHFCEHMCKYRLLNELKIVPHKILILPFASSVLGN